MKTIIVSFCMLFSGLIVLAFIWDIVKTAIAKHKNQDYTWQSIGIFQESSSAFSVIVWGVVLIIGFYGFFIIIEDEIASKYELSMEECGYCETEYPIIYGVRDFYGNMICPQCMRSVVSDISSDEIGICENCNYPYNKTRVEGIGLCSECFWDYYGECSICGDYAPPDLRNQYDECVCTDCITEALHDKSVARALDRYFE